MKEKSRKYPFVNLSCILLLVMGFQMAGFQLTLSAAAEQFHFGKTGMGILVAVRGVSMILAPLIFGTMADRKGKRPVLLVSALMLVVGAFFSGFAPSILFYVIGTFLIGAGSVTNEAVCSAAISDLYPMESNKLLSMTQFFFSAGGIIGPLLLQFAMDRFQVRWQVMFLVFGAAFALLMIPLVRAKLPHTEAGQAEALPKNPFHFFRSATYTLLFCCVIFYVGMDFSVGSFIDTLFGSHLNAPKLGALAISVYWAGMALSRLLTGIRSMTALKTMVVYFIASTVSLLGLALSNDPMVSLVFSGIVGISFGPLWASFLVLAAAEFPRQSAGAIGVLGMGSGIGGVVYPVVVGAMADTLDIRSAFLVLTAASLIGMILSLFYRRGQIKKRNL